MLHLVYKYIPFKSFYNRLDEFQKILILSSSFSVGLSVFRIGYTGETMFLFLVWNLFLAFLPYSLSLFIKDAACYTQRRYLMVLMLIWLLLIPNAFYILTDLFHLRKVEVVPLWYDLALISSFAWNGLIMGIMSVRHLEKLIVDRWQLCSQWAFIIPVMYLNALGIYIGRYLRFNSWDVFANPLQLIRDVFYILTHPLEHRFDWSMIVCFTIMLSLFYLTIKALSRMLVK